MRTTGSVEEVRELVAGARRDERRVGCVPTMGALHRGHTSLIQAAVADCGFVVVTLFVNAPQFDDSVDFQRYPRPLEEDLAICRELGVDPKMIAAAADRIGEAVAEANLREDVPLHETCLVVIGRGVVLANGTVDNIKRRTGEQDLEEAFIQMTAAPPVMETP